MTACSKAQDTSMGKKAVSAALAGTLAVGMVPGVALAATADEPEAGDGISALAMESTTDFSNGAVTGMTIDGAAVSVEKGATTIAKSSFGAKDITVKVSQITTGTGTVVNANKDNTWTISYSTTESGSYTEATNGVIPNAALTGSAVYVKVTSTSKPYATAAVTVKVNLEAAQLTGAFACGEKLSDRTFTYNAGDQIINFALPGATEVLDSTKDFDITWFKGTGSDTTALAKQPTDAGTYTAVLSGKGNYQGKVPVSVTIAPFDLSKASIVIGDQVKPGESDPALELADWTIASIDGEATGVDAADATDAEKTAAAIASKLELTKCTESPDNLPGYTELGKYTFTVGAAEVDNKANPNFTGTASVSANLVGSNTVSWLYNNTVYTPTDGAATMTVPAINLQNGDALFNIANLKVGKKVTTDTVDSSTVNTIAEDDALTYTYTVKDADGNIVDNSSLSKPGKWTVVAAVNSVANDYTYGGTMSFTVNVIAGTITNNDIVVKQNGTVVANPVFTYDGSNVLDDLDVTVTSGKTTLVQGTDYTLKVTNAADDEVSEIVNANKTGQTYKVTVDAPGYTVQNATFTVTVNPITAEELRIAGEVEGANGDKFIPYTGEVINPVIEYTTDKDAKEPVWTVLPAELYSLTIAGTAGDADGDTEMKELGTYAVTVNAKTLENGMSDNYNFTTGGINSLSGVVVSKGDVKFQDVPATAWYFNSVNDAADQGYMSGYAGTKLFGPNDKITRGQVACVLFNMAGGSGVGPDNFVTDNTGYVTGFSDVDGHMYYAKAIAWAKTTGVVNGYAGTDKFGPNDYVTREQFACMLANYAKAMNNYVAIDDVAEVLASKPDGSKVSGWARDNVAWAVSNKYMGNGGVITPLGNITRAEVAAMAINYQPKSFANAGTVTSSVKSIKVTPATVTLAPKATQPVTVDVTVTGNAAKTWTASSDKEAVATVAEDGTITAVADGTAVITYKSTVDPSVVATCTVKVETI